MDKKTNTKAFRFSGFKNVVYSKISFRNLDISKYNAFVYGLLTSGLVLAIFGMNVNAVYPTITNITLNPKLDITYFGTYNVTATIIDPQGVDASYVNISGINGDGGNCWKYYINGSCAEDTPIKTPMSLLSGNVYVSSVVRPDDIYPQISFGDSGIFWYNAPQKIDILREKYHILHFINNYTMVENMSFWIEFDAVTKPSTTRSIQVYLVKQGQSITFFNQDWINDPETELVGSVTTSDLKDHTHTTNSGHYLIKLTTNSDGTVGSKNLNISSDFWIVLRANIGLSTDAWSLNYRNSSLCNNSNNWYVGGAWWTTTYQNGCPDAHVHFARKNEDYMDCVNMTVCANDTLGNLSCSSNQTCFAELPNLPPTPTGFIYPENETYCGNINIAWAACIDPNGDAVNYNLTLRNLDGSYNLSINENLATTNYLWDSTHAQDGIYDLLMICCDPSNSCSNFTLSQDYGNFTINNTACQVSAAIQAQNAGCAAEKNEYLPNETLYVEVNCTLAGSPCDIYVCPCSFNDTDYGQSLPGATGCVLANENSSVGAGTACYGLGNVSEYGSPCQCFDVVLDSEGKGTYGNASAQSLDNDAVDSLGASCDNCEPATSAGFHVASEAGTLILIGSGLFAIYGYARVRKKK